MISIRYFVVSKLGSIPNKTPDAPERVSSSFNPDSTRAAVTSVLNKGDDKNKIEYNSETTPEYFGLARYFTILLGTKPGLSDFKCFIKYRNASFLMSSYINPSIAASTLYFSFNEVSFQNFKSKPSTTVSIVAAVSSGLDNPADSKTSSLAATIP